MVLCLMKSASLIVAACQVGGSKAEAVRLKGGAAEGAERDARNAIPSPCLEPTTSLFNLQHAQHQVTGLETSPMVALSGEARKKTENVLARFLL